ncbi:hypothetical protein Q8A73_016447 [Channa argus]|nr:hypothetical protein Q8A73_016447 [Channa argus]
MQHCDAFDYWGKGTEIIVSSGTSLSPTLYPVVLCKPGSEAIITVGCLALDFYPKSLTFQWTDASGTTQTSVQYPLAEQNNQYIGVSLVQVSKSDWDSRKSFSCVVTHPAGPKSMKVEKDLVVSVAPKLTLLSESSGDNIVLVCTIEDFLPKEFSFNWKKNGNEVNQYTIWAPQKTGQTYSAVSVLKVKSTDWDSKHVYTCEVMHQGTTYTKMASKEAPVTVTLNHSSPKEIFSNNQVEVKCVITGQDKNTVEKSEITWQIDGQKVISTLEPTKTESESQHIKTSTVTLTRAEWERVNKVSCSALKEDMTQIVQELIVNKGDGSEPRVTVHILPEQYIGQGDSAEVTLVCLVSSPVLQDYYITWSEDEGHNSGNYDDGINFPPQKTPNGYLVTSVYTTTRKKWDKISKLFHCNIWPAGRNNTMKSHGVSKVMEPAKVTLVSVPSEDTQALVCMIEYGRAGTLDSFKWKKNGAELDDYIQSSFQRIGDSRSAVSVLKVKNTEWDSKAVYTCEVTYQGQTYTKKVSKDPITVTMNQPSPKEMFTNNQAVLECVITGQDKAVVDEIEITWKIDGKK